jgi:hypothetical protein
LAHLRAVPERDAVPDISSAAEYSVGQVQAASGLLCPSTVTVR